jgi:hypothetical protein
MKMTRGALFVSVTPLLWFICFGLGQQPKLSCGAAVHVEELAGTL